MSQNHNKEKFGGKEGQKEERENDTMEANKNWEEKMRHNVKIIQ